MQRRGALAAMCAAALLLFVACAGDTGKPPAGPYQVTEVFDGDSFNLRAANGKIVRVRIAGIDAPEKSQPYANKAKESLQSLLASGAITLEPIKIDTYDRWITHVRVNGSDVGLSQITRGYAWFFTRYRSDLSDAMQAEYARAERDARDGRVGLWAGLAAKGNPALTPEPPWEFRRKKKSGGSAMREPSHEGQHDPGQY